MDRKEQLRLVWLVLSKVQVQNVELLKRQKLVDEFDPRVSDHELLVVSYE